jgi:DNA polymerase IV
MDHETPSSSKTGPADSQPQFTDPKVPSLRDIPPILIISAHFKGSEEYDLEELLRQHGAPITSDVAQAKVFIGKVGTKRRADFELRARKFKVEPAVEHIITNPPKDEGPPSKRRKLEGSPGNPIAIHDEGSTTEEEVTEEEAENERTEGSETEDELPSQKQDTPVSSPVKLDGNVELAHTIFENHTSDDIIWVVNVHWFDQCVSRGSLLPLGDHLVYKGKVLERPSPPKASPGSIKPIFCVPESKMTPSSQLVTPTRPVIDKSILDRAKSDVGGSSPSASKYQPHRQSAQGSRRFDGKTFSSSTQQAGQTASQISHLLQQTTSEFEGNDSDIPEAPQWVKKRVKYACQRFTPADGPNEDFIGLLKKIRTARTLINDEIGVRAYSTIIASIAAYPFKLIHPREILRLPGCDIKVSNLWVEWKNTGKIQAVEDFENDEAMKVLRTFYDIWGVGAKTARQFYYNNHWTELDDIIEFGWNDLDRVQQIGLKYYDEFLEGIPRAEVEQIADVVREHAVRLRDDRITVTIVGGYRRGKAESGDVDMIISHPDLDATSGLVREMVESLEESEWITHTLTMSLHGTARGQSTLPFRTTKASGAGFDTLDKALVVWQNPEWATKEKDKLENENAKNPNIHRRVDIIIAPWRTVGCAVMGWSGGTTFQRDLRRYAKYVKGWKFDSSGIRSRSSGEVVQLEGPNGIDGTPEDAEKAVFKGLGLEFVPPDQRCTN